MLALEFAFSPDLLNQMKSYLGLSSFELEGMAPEATGSQSFGVSPASLGCASDATKAQKKVKAAIAEMSLGLQGYIEALTELETRTRTAEENAEVEIAQHFDVLLGCQTPTIAAAGGGACTAEG